jgi:Sec-independent protein translocase protein TatA
MAEEVTLNQLGTMIEGLRGDVKAVAEGPGVIRSEMKQMKAELLEKFEENKAEIRWVAKDLGRKIDETKQEIKEVKEKVGKIDRTLDAHVKSRCSNRDPDFSPLAKTSGLPAHV